MIAQSFVKMLLHSHMNKGKRGYVFVCTILKQYQF